ERGNGDLVRPERAHERMAAELRDRLPAPGGDAGLRPAEQLVAAEGDDVRAVAHGLRNGLLAAQPESRGVEERPAAEVVDERDAALAREAREVAGCGLGHEPAEREVARVDPQDRPGLLGDGTRVV